MRAAGLALLLLCGCECDSSRPAVKAEPTVPAITHQTLDRLSLCQKLEAAFPAAALPDGLSEEEKMRRAIEAMAARAGEVGQACGFETGERYMGFIIRVQVARADRSDDLTLEQFGGGPSMQARELENERAWQSELDAGRMTAAQLAEKRGQVVEARSILERTRVRAARRKATTHLDVAAVTESARGRAPALVERVEAQGRSQPPISEAERRALASWMPPP